MDISRWALQTKKVLLLFWSSVFFWILLAIQREIILVVGLSSYLLSCFTNPENNSIWQDKTTSQWFKILSNFSFDDILNQKERRREEEARRRAICWVCYHVIFTIHGNKSIILFDYWDWEQRDIYYTLFGNSSN